MNTTVSQAKILIVGGSSGMGLALAAKLLSQGAQVIIAGRHLEKLRSAQTALGKPDNLHIMTADISNETRGRDLLTDLETLDHIVCTAADIDGAYQLLPDLELDAVNRVIASKLTGPLLLAKYGAPVLSKSGSITFTSGIAAYRPSARGSIVAAANAALEGLIRALAVELAPLRVNTVSPGWIDTAIWDKVAGTAKQETLKAMADRLPVGRIGRPGDIADALYFLMTSAFTSGTVLHVEGGHRLV